MSNEAMTKVEQKENGRWYIKMGYAGFNTRANNSSGYASEAAALAVIRRLDPSMRNVLEPSYAMQIPSGGAA